MTASAGSIRFGSSLNAHLHSHCAVIDGVFDSAAGGVVFHAATGLEATAITQVQAQVRLRMLRVFVRCSLLPGDDVQALGQWEHGGGFSVDASVPIAAAGRAGGGRLLRNCAQPPFALDRLHELDPVHLVHDSANRGPGGTGPLLLALPSLLSESPPRIRRRCFGVLALTAAHWKLLRQPRTAGDGR